MLQKSIKTIFVKTGLDVFFGAFFTTYEASEVHEIFLSIDIFGHTIEALMDITFFGVDVQTGSLCIFA